MLAGSIVACGDVVAPTVRTDLQTDSQAYMVAALPAGYEVTIGLRYTNRSSEPVYVGNCRGDFPSHLEKWVAGKWVVAWSGVWLACLSDPIVIPPGGRHDAVLNVSAGYPGSNVYPKWRATDIPGQYRVVAETLYSAQAPLAVEQCASNAFTLSLGEP